MLAKIKKILAASENRESFFARVERYHSKYAPRRKLFADSKYSENEYEFIERAYNDGKKAVEGIKRENGERYFEHMRAVAIILIDYLFIFEQINLRISAYKILAASLLHDVVEDCPEWNLNRVKQEYGREVAWLLDYVSKRPKSDYNGDTEAQLKFYHNRFATAPIEFFLIKLADRLHNQITLWCCDPDKIRRKMLETLKYYIPWARKLNILPHELEATTNNFEERLQIHTRQCDIR